VEKGAGNLGCDGSENLDATLVGTSASLPFKLQQVNNVFISDDNETLNVLSVEWLEKPVLPGYCCGS
jgi:hypothetical protein